MSYLKASHHPWKTNIASGELPLLRGQTEGWLQWSSHERVMMGHTDYCLIGHRVSRVDIRDCDWTDMNVSDWTEMNVSEWTDKSVCDRTDKSDCDWTDKSVCDWTDMSDCDWTDKSVCDWTDQSDCDWTDMRVSDWIDMSVFHWIEGHLDKHPNHLLFLLHHSSVIPTLCEAIALLISRET